MPLHGAGSKNAIDNYVDRYDTETYKTLDDDGNYVLAVCLSDLKKNVPYSPYSLKIISTEESKYFNSYFMFTASCVTKVKYT